MCFTNLMIIVAPGRDYHFLNLCVCTSFIACNWVNFLNWTPVYIFKCCVGREGRKREAQVNSNPVSQKKEKMRIWRTGEPLNSRSKFCLCDQRVKTASTVVEGLLFNCETYFNSKKITVSRLTSSSWAFLVSNHVSYESTYVSTTEHLTYFLKFYGKQYVSLLSNTTTVLHFIAIIVKIWTNSLEGTAISSKTKMLLTKVQDFVKF